MEGGSGENKELGSKSLYVDQDDVPIKGAIATAPQSSIGKLSTTDSEGRDVATRGRPTVGEEVSRGKSLRVKEQEASICLPVDENETKAKLNEEDDQVDAAAEDVPKLEESPDSPREPEACMTDRSDNVSRASFLQLEDVVKKIQRDVKRQDGKVTGIGEEVKQNKGKLENLEKGHKRHCVEARGRCLRNAATEPK